MTDLSTVKLDGVRQRIDAAVRNIESAQKLNEQMQKTTVAGSTEWHQHETIDDRLHDALGDLGN